jgi:hypothetical protein
MTRDETRIWLVRFLLHRVRADRYPSTTELDLIENMIPTHLLDEYLRVLVEKADADRYPSISLLRRIARVIDRLPRRRSYRDLGHGDDLDEDEVVNGGIPVTG